MRSEFVARLSHFPGPVLIVRCHLTVSLRTETTLRRAVYLVCFFRPRGRTGHIFLREVVLTRALLSIFHPFLVHFNTRTPNYSYALTRNTSTGQTRPISHRFSFSSLLFLSPFFLAFPTLTKSVYCTLAFFSTTTPSSSSFFHEIHCLSLPFKTTSYVVPPLPLATGSFPAPQIHLETSHILNFKH